MHQLIVAAALIHGGGMPTAQPEPLRVPTLNGLVEALETSYPLTADKVNAIFFAKRGRLATVREHWLAKHRLGERCTDDMLEAFVADPDAVLFGVPSSIPTFRFPTFETSSDSLRDVLYVSQDGQYWVEFSRPHFWSFGSFQGFGCAWFSIYGFAGISGYCVCELVLPLFNQPQSWQPQIDGNGMFNQPTQKSGLFFSDGFYYSIRSYRFEHWGYHDFALHSQFVAPTPWFPPGSSVPVPRVNTVRGARNTREISNGGWSYQRMINPFQDLR